MALPITLLTSGILGLWYVVMIFQVISMRRKTEISLGDEGNAQMMRRMRGQANFVEFVPFALIMIATLELSGFKPLGIWAGAGCLILGRLLHGYAFMFTEKSVIGRSGGTVLTLISFIILSVSCIWMALGQFGMV